MLTHKNFCYLKCEYFEMSVASSNCFLDHEINDLKECPYKLEIVMLRKKSDEDVYAENLEKFQELWKNAVSEKAFEKKYEGMPYEAILAIEQEAFEARINKEREEYKIWKENNE